MKRERAARSPDDVASRGVALASLHAAVALFGFAGLFGKWIDLPPPAIVLGRAGIAALALGVLLAVRRESLGRFEWRIAISGALLAAHWFTFFQAIQSAGVAVGLLGFASFPVFVVLLEAMFLGRQASTRELLATALVCTGLLLVVPSFDFGDRAVQGLAWGVFSGASFALLAVCNRAFAAGSKALRIALWQNAIAALCLVPAVALAPSMPSAHDLMMIIVLGVVCTALAHTLFIKSLRAVSAHTASVVACLEPVYGIALAVVLLHEVPNLRTAAGGVMIVGAAMWETLAARPQEAAG
ncbi:MAG: DMT family transporter [Betaproteobacteria bacterium]